MSINHFCNKGAQTLTIFAKLIRKYVRRHITMTSSFCNSRGFPFREKHNQLNNGIVKIKKIVGGSVYRVQFFAWCGARDDIFLPMLKAGTTRDISTFYQLTA